MHNYLKGLIAALCVFFSAYVLSQPIAFHNSNYGTSVSYPSANAACQAAAGLYGYTLSGVVRMQPNRWYCNRTTSFGSTEGFSAAYQEGSECPDGGVLNEVEGSCGLPEPEMLDGQMCADQQGHSVGNPMVYDKTTSQCVALADSDLDTTCSYFGGRGETAYSVAGQLDSGGNAVAPPTFTGQMGCQVATVSSSECTLNVQGAIGCNVTAKFTGKVGESSGPDPRDAGCEGNKCKPVEQTTSVTDNPCVMSGNSCTSETESSTTGKQNCGTVNGSYTCITVKPTSSGTKTQTTSTSETNPDGTVKTTKTDDVTKTKCTDVKTCTDSKSTTTTTSTTNKSGQTTGTSTVCTGTCASVSSGGGSGNGTGNGDGEEDDGDGTASESDDCTIPPKCDGDPYLCSILRQEFINSCAERALPTDKEKAEFQALLAKQKTELDANQKTLDDKVSSLVGQFQSVSSSGSTGGRCFEDKTFAVMGHSFSLPFSQVCSILEWFRYAVLAVAYLISFRLLTKDL
ncbi:Uncharacterized protein ABJ99_5162 [Pseudomonas syringae pv. cilantro]|uniref:Uncharacterized protein n=2 Tax=Pseudomonas syringae group TaxID=136849 RepID=A0A0N0GCE9_PSESX|nr:MULTISPECIES: virulence factor TspB C-terminal domain-related protein [Pseudomonas syringae group]KPC23595.1 Uncharacterized protein ABJ99_5162 [Pseudomonas syringae pv. cilantro]KPW76990.1 Uncharacterized protein ALO76_00002 [Pseudomonas syringae pv. coriandricola]RMN08837.1 hypothetical protein ALQ65_200311 [Pseudomonas syringae pv. coriandricola]